jgi:hypothetical protein
LGIRDWEGDGYEELEIRLLKWIVVESSFLLQGINSNIREILAQLHILLQLINQMTMHRHLTIQPRRLSITLIFTILFLRLFPYLKVFRRRSITLLFGIYALCFFRGIFVGDLDYKGLG